MLDREIQRLAQAFPRAKELEQPARRLLNDLRESDLISGLILGSDESMAYFWNVYTRDVTLSETSAKPYCDLDEKIADFELAVSDITKVGIRMSACGPSAVAGILEQCRDRKIEAIYLDLP